MPLTAPPSGKQFVLELGRQTAVVTEVGGGVRSYTVAGHEVLDGYALHEMCSDARGQVFVPWPNRVSDGRYRFHGVDHQLPLSEPAAHNAIHGLTRGSSWQLVHSNHQTLRLAHLLHPQPGYPFALRCELAYRLRSAGLAVEIRATNVGATACPYATGAHPYLTLGTATVDDIAVRVPADTYYPTDDRGIPTGRRAVQGSGYDLRRAERLGDRVLDTAFTDLAPDPGGGSSVLVCAP